MNTSRTNPYSPTTIDIPREETASLLSKVLGITSLGFLITATASPAHALWPEAVCVRKIQRKAPHQVPELRLGYFENLK